MRKITVALLLFAGLWTATTVTSGAIGPVKSVTPQCSGIKLSLMYYYQPRATRLNNQVTVTIDDISYSEQFGANYFRTFYWSPDTDHDWQVSIDGNRLMGSATVNDSIDSGVQLVCTT